MENPASFDLDRALRNWRTQLVDSSSVKRENMDELEIHLRDSVARLRAAGLSEEEAWVIAQRRLGQIDSLEQEFAKITADPTPPPLRRDVRLIRSFIAIGAGVVFTLLAGFVAESSAFRSLFEREVAVDLREEVTLMQDFSTSVQLSLLGFLAGALLGGYITALIARHHPMKHALTAGGATWFCLTVLRGLQAESWLLWILIGAAMTSAMLLGAMVCELRRPRWRISMLTAGGYRRFSRRAGVLSVVCMVGAIIAGLAERATTTSLSESLYELMCWLIIGAGAAAISAIALATIPKLKTRKLTRLA